MLDEIGFLQVLAQKPLVTCTDVDVSIRNSMKTID